MTTTSRSCLLWAGLLLSSVAQALTPFTGEFDVFEDGDRLGQARLELVASGPRRWTFTTVTEGEGGLAGFLGARIEERSELLETDGVLSTLDYKYKQEVAWRDRERSLSVNPDNGQIREKDRKDSWSYAATGPVLDRHAIVLAVSTDLATTGAPAAHAVAHKGEINDWRFTAGASEKVQTDLGPIDAVRLERVRANQERKTISWHAPKYGFLPIVIEQIEPDGKHYRMQLKRWIRSP